MELVCDSWWVSESSATEGNGSGTEGNGSGTEGNGSGTEGNGSGTEGNGSGKTSSPLEMCVKVRELLGGASFVSLAGQHTFC